MSMPLRILFVGSSAGVGLSYHLSSISVNLQNSGNQVTVISSPGEQIPDLSALLEKNNIPKLTCPSFDKQSIVDVIRSIGFLKKAIKTYKIDVIHAQGVLGAFEAYFAIKSARKKVAVVTSVHFVPMANSSNRFKWSTFVSILNHCTDLVLPVSSFTGDALITHGLKPKKLIVLHNTLDLKTFDKATSEPSPVKKTDFGINIVCVGNLSPIKGQEYLLLAAEKILKSRKATFYLVGSGASEESLKKLALNLKIANNVVFTGRISWPNVYSVLVNLADICVLPSVTENFPFYILECMAAGKPIVATNVGGVAEAITDGSTGLLVQPKNPDELAEKISSLIDDAELREKLGSSARIYLERNFDIPIYLQKITEIYRIACSM
ncbi:MAG: glycosyltransferase family 4 protein [Candidatus Bathyarchaeota archaeon]|nr:glycosyltransferase family 4 protein [Candidatus Bathyarchaeota archaeon]